jgi:hypothetical protein
MKVVYLAFHLHYGRQHLREVQSFSLKTVLQLPQSRGHLLTHFSLQCSQIIVLLRGSLNI